MKSDKKILIVEDEWFIAQDAKEKIEELGYTVCGIAPSGEEAIEMVKKVLPDLIFMDIMLKGDMDGIEAARQIVANHAIPIVYVTAYASHDLMERVKITGPYGYILKPFKEAELHTAIEIAFYKHEMEAKLLQAQKLESIGILAGGFAHDFNNILFPVMGYAEMLQDDLPLDSPFQKYVEGIIKGTKLASKLVRQILIISCQAKEALKPLYLQSILRKVMKLSESVSPASIEIKHEIDELCGMIMADQKQLQDVVMNLMSNAFHAMEKDGGILRISLKEINRAVENAPYICLTVSDTGIGMNKETKEKIFEPYFTTKKIGKGSGLGLSLAYAIIRYCNGEIVCESEPGRGTTFTIYLPRVASKIIDNTKADRLRKTENESVLFVDDEKAITQIVKYNLERFGYKVSSFTNSLTALETFQENPEEFDICITDMAMPHMTGDKLIKALRAIRHDLPVILCTGFDEQLKEDVSKESRINGFLMKPVDRDKMVQVIRKVLDEAKG